MLLILLISILQSSIVSIRGQSKMEPYVVHGNYTNIQEFPYVAFIAIEQDEAPWSCGSSIVNQNLILTAAHCLIGCTNDANIVISVGHEKMLMGVISSANGFVIHENYNQEISINDIALVRVHTPIVFNSFVGRVALMRNPPQEDEAVIAGWGLIDEKKRMPTERLKFTKQHVLTKQECVNQMSSMPVGTFCAAVVPYGGYPSIGDSGSALVIRKYIQIGIVSYKKPDISRKLIVYTDTAYFYNWIRKNAKRLACCGML